MGFIRLVMMNSCGNNTSVSKLLSRSGSGIDFWPKINENYGILVQLFHKTEITAKVTSYRVDVSLIRLVMMKSCGNDNPVSQL